MHFSPRPNRAREIGWNEWSAAAFERAKNEDKPVLLGISAVWCHWCHVMDETTYSDESVITAIKERFIPIRVDNDERPDINARYNMGGWPTTVFLTPDGSIITGATYLPPAQMHRALDEISGFYAANKTQIAERSQELREKHRNHLAASNGAHQLRSPENVEQLNLSIVEEVVETLKNAYDSVYGGFGEEQKFPQSEALALLLQEYRVTGETQLLEMVTTTLRNMSTGGTYDHVEGGFFRYSTMRDWSVPHFEKMSEDHAGLLRVLADIAVLGTDTDLRLSEHDRELVAPDKQPWILETLQSATAYVRNVLRDPQTGLFAGSQDADEEYFAKSLEERRTMQAPFVDRRSYSNRTAALAGSFFAVARAFANANAVKESHGTALAHQLAAEAQATLDHLYDHAREDDAQDMRVATGLLFHVISPGGTPSVQGLLTDQVAFVRALIDAYEFTNESRFLERAIAHADRTIARFAAKDGGFYDRIAVKEPEEASEPLGNLAIQDRPIAENGLFAEALLRLALLSGETRFHDAAEGALLVYAQSYQQAGSFAATYARATRRYVTPALCTERGCI